MINREKIISDFDEIAELNESGDNNSVFHKLILSKIQPNTGKVLDIGCGKGELTRLISQKALKVTGVDISEGMIYKATELSREFNNIKYFCGIFLKLMRKKTVMM